MATQILKVRGMTCNHCVQALSKSLRAIPGVQDACVDLQCSTARVDYDDQVSGVSDLIAAVQRAGYEVEGLEAG